MERGGLVANVKKDKTKKPTNADWNAWRATGAALGMSPEQLDEVYGPNYGQYVKARAQKASELAAWVRTLPKANNGNPG